MYPNQQQTPIDYLNQIAPQPVKKMPFTRRQLIIFGGLGAAILLVIVLVIAVAGTHSTKPDQQLAARLITTETIATSAQDTINSSALQALNSNLTIYLTNTNRDIVAPLAAQGVSATNLDKSIVTAESGTALSARLQDAKLNAVFDNTYAREMDYQINTILILMQQIYKSTGNKSLKTFLTSAYTNLQPIEKQFSQFNSTDS